MSNWTYDEYKHCGVDYSNETLSKKYDNNHQSFRNYEKEFESMIEFLSIKNPNEITAIDLGCGTGATSFYAAKKFKKVYGVDVSDAMINLAKDKLSESDTNIEFVQAGFLTYHHKDEPVDLLITKAAFHHLPDFWKQVALLNMNKMLKMGGILYIFDIVFDFSLTEYNEKVNAWVNGFEERAGKEFKKEVETHIRDEYSTFKWILDKMLEQAGFRIESCRSQNGFETEYHCVKIGEV